MTKWLQSPKQDGLWVKEVVWENRVAFLVNTQSVHQFSDRHGVIAVVWNSATEWQVISVGMMYLLVLVSVPLSFCCILQHCWKALAQFVMKGFNKSISLTRSLCLNIILLVCCPFSIQQFIFWRVSVPLHLQQMTLFFFVFLYFCVRVLSITLC